MGRGKLLPFFVSVSGRGMRKEEWEVISSIDRKLNRLLAKFDQVGQNTEDIAELETTIKKEVADIWEVLEDFRQTQKIRRRIRRVIIWGISILVTGALMAFADREMNAFLDRWQGVNHSREVAEQTVVGE